MRYAVMQPTFLPWIGYFRLIAEADHFFFLDTAQLSKQSWQTRNRILIGEREHWITVPIIHESLDQRINATRIAQPTHWRRKSARQIVQSYARHAFKQDLLDLVAWIENGVEETLSDMNETLIVRILEKIGVARPIRRASELNLTRTNRTDRLIEIGEGVGASTYISPVGARDYLTDDRFVERTSIRLEFMDRVPPAYSQRQTAQHVSHLSIVDVIGNLGWRGTAELLRADWPRINVNLPSRGEEQRSGGLALRRAVAEDSRVILAWRNDPTSRENSRNEAEIEWPEHSEWFAC